MNKRNVSIFVRVTEKEKQRISNKAEKCRLSISEYLRKRALGYAPKAILPETFYEFSERLGNIYEALGANGNADMQEQILSLIDEVQLKLLNCNSADDSGSDFSGLPQSLLCGKEEQPRNDEFFVTCDENE